MKLNRTTFKVLLSLAIIVSVTFWAVDSVRARTYSGSNLNFIVADGSFSITNSSDESILTQFYSTGARGFTVLSASDDVLGSSVREDSTSDRTNLFEFDLPLGRSEFSIVGGSNVHFSAETNISLQATVNPMTDGNRNTTILVAVLVVLGALFYLSQLNGHLWVSASRRQNALDQATEQDAENQVFQRMFRRAKYEK